MRVTSSIMVHFLVAVQLVLLSGCYPQSGVRQPVWAERANHDLDFGQALKVREVFLPCANSKGRGSLDYRSFAGILMALQERDWMIGNVDSDSRSINARACLRNNPLHCAWMTLRLIHGSRVEIVPSENAALNPKLVDDVTRWLTMLDQSFSKYRCQTEDAFDQIANQYGLEPFLEPRFKD